MAQDIITGGGAIAPSSPASRDVGMIQGGRFSPALREAREAHFAELIAKAERAAGTKPATQPQPAPPGAKTVTIEGVELATPALLKEINPALAKLLGEGGGPHAMEARLMTAQNVLLDILREVKNDDALHGTNNAAASLQSFEALPPSAMQSLLIEFSKPPSTAPVALQPAAMVAQWAAQGETEETLLENWLARGEDAQVNFSRIYARFSRIDARIQPADHPPFLFWYTHLDPTTKAAFLLALLHGADTPLHMRFGAAS